METLHRGSKILGQVFFFFPECFSQSFREHTSKQTLGTLSYAHVAELRVMPKFRLNPVRSLGRWWQCWLCNSLQPCYWQASSGNYNLPSEPDFRGVRWDCMAFFRKETIHFRSFSPHFVHLAIHCSIIVIIWTFQTFALNLSKSFKGSCSWWHLYLSILVTLDYLHNGDGGCIARLLEGQQIEIQTHTSCYVLWYCASAFS